MISAIVLINADVDQVPEVAAALVEIEGVKEVYSVAGSVDLIAMVKVSEHDQLADIIADKIGKVAGVTDTDTHIAFRTYSKQDLGAAFSLGVE